MERILFSGFGGRAQNIRILFFIFLSVITIRTHPLEIKKTVNRLSRSYNPKRGERGGDRERERDGSFVIQRRKHNRAGYIQLLDNESHPQRRNHRETFSFFVLLIRVQSGSLQRVS